MSKSGMLLLNLGGPEAQADVQPFLYNLFADPELIRLPFPFLQRAFAWAISTLRAEKSRRNYAAIGGGDPPCGALLLSKRENCRPTWWLRAMTCRCMLPCATGIR